MEILYKVLMTINTVILSTFGLAFSLQLIYILLFFLPAKKYKKSEKKYKFGIIICARNEAGVIAETLKCLNDQSYPKDLYDIFVIAHNCTDDTADIARAFGAIVYEEKDSDPKHQRVSYALKALFEKILKEHDNYDAFIRFDADTFMRPDYIDKMNDAFAFGTKLAKGYNNSKNITENIVSGISGLWYIRDSRFNCHARSVLRLGQLMPGSGMMISADIIRKNGGWIDMGLTEDADFSISELLKGNKAEYVKDAVLYEDQPTTVKDTFVRNMRIGKGLNKTFRNYGIRSFFKFFKTFKFTYFDMFITEFFIPVALIAILWLPAFYIYAIAYNLAIGNITELILIGNTAGWALLLAFVTPFILQAILVYILEYKRIKAPFWRMLPSILLFPMFMIIYALGIVFGILTKAKWKAVNRNKKITYDEFKIKFNFETYKSKDVLESIRLPKTILENTYNENINFASPLNNSTEINFENNSLENEHADNDKTVNIKTESEAPLNFSKQPND